LFDLIIFPLSLDTGRELYELPGLLVLGAPRKAARMRAQDQLVIYCRLVTISANGSGVTAVSGGGLTKAQLQEIMSRLAETYFTFSGSVTAGLRAVAARLNDFLLSRNLKTPQEGQIVGTLNLAVIHGERLVVAHAGATHSFLLSKTQVQHFDDGMAGRGLGLSRQAIPRFYQTTLEAGDLLVVCADPPATWTQKMLANSPQLSFEHLRRRLLSEAGEDLQIGVVRVQPGKGQISFWRPGEAQRQAGRSGSRPVHSKPRPAPEEIPARVDLPKTPPASGLKVENQAPTAPEPDAGFSFGTTDVPSLEAIPLEQPGPLDGELSILDQQAPARENGKDHGFSSDGVAGVIKTGTEEPISPLPPTPQPIRQGPVRAGGNRVIPNHARGTEPSRQSQSQRSPLGQRPMGGGEANEPTARSQKNVRAVGKPQRGPGAFQKGLTAFGQKIGLGLQRMAPFWAKSRRGMAAAVARVIPRKVDSEGRTEPFFNLSSAQMLAIALITPLIVVAVALTIFTRLGRSEQFQKNFLAAQRYAQLAEQQKDPIQQREDWKQAYASLLEGDKFGKSDESQALKTQVLNALDGLEGFVRLNYRPVVSGGFPPEVKITRIVTTLNDVYLLDSSQGRILRLYRTASGYDLDPSFNCGAGKAGTMIINPLIDMAALSPNNDMHSTVMGIDAGGNLVYCSPSQSGFDSRPLALPDSGWGTIVGMTLYNDSLYILDPKTNAVYRYDGNNGVFPDRPHLYFDTTIPQMNDVIDLAVDQEFLHLLHSDGRMTVCESSGFAFTATRCTDPAPYGDTRPGFEPAPLTFLGSHFIHIQTTQPPDPSLFALDAANKSIYHLSLRRLNLQRQYRPLPNGDYQLPNESPTAFAISPNRRALLAFGNQVFFAMIP
jgi:hypothetical protein